MNRVKFTLLTAGFVLAMAFTFSCSGDDGKEDGGSSSSTEGGGQVGGSSSSGGTQSDVSSSSSEPSSSSEAESSSSEAESSSSVQSSSSLEVAIPCSADFETVPIGTQTWMTKNLNCNVEGSKCYGDDPANCTK